MKAVCLVQLGKWASWTARSVQLAERESWTTRLVQLARSASWTGQTRRAGKLDWSNSPSGQVGLVKLAERASWTACLVQLSRSASWTGQTRRAGELDCSFGPTRPFSELDWSNSPSGQVGLLVWSNSPVRRVGLVKLAERESWTARLVQLDRSAIWTCQTRRAGKLDCSSGVTRPFGELDYSNSPSRQVGLLVWSNSPVWRFFDFYIPLRIIFSFSEEDVSREFSEFDSVVTDFDPNRSVVSGRLVLLSVECDNIGAAPCEGCLRTLVEGINPFKVRLGVKTSVMGLGQDLGLITSLGGAMTTSTYVSHIVFDLIPSRFEVHDMFSASATSRNAEDGFFFRMPRFVLEMFAGLKMFRDIERLGLSLRLRNILVCLRMFAAKIVVHPLSDGAMVAQILWIGVKDVFTRIAKGVVDHGTFVLTLRSSVDLANDREESVPINALATTFILEFSLSQMFSMLFRDSLGSTETERNDLMLEDFS
uniref:Uncharacterized protein n=1 Tax=Brassica oleracea var. oleracea TaxID=109376 RepID=A0A0D3A8R8_BRAOL